MSTTVIGTVAVVIELKGGAFACDRPVKQAPIIKVLELREIGHGVLCGGDRSALVCSNTSGDALLDTVAALECAACGGGTHIVWNNAHIGGEAGRETLIVEL